MAKKPNKPTAEKQFALREKAKSELERLEDVYSDDVKREKIQRFKEKFGICEIVYKVILDDHQFNKTGKHPERMKVDMTQVPYALTYAGYDYDKNLLINLFGREDRKGRRSVKKLRDSLTHSMNQNAIDELLDREAELYGYMDLFLAKIRDFDSVAKTHAG